MKDLSGDELEKKLKKEESVREGLMKVEDE